jgi:transcriptional regulator with XRE-family HTH domain
MIADVVARIHERLAALNLSARKASLAAGLGEDGIRNLERAAKERPNQGASIKTIIALSPVLKTTVAWLLEGRDEDVNESTSRRVAVVGLVGAGSVAALFSSGQGPFDEVEAPSNATDSTVALGIRGISLGPAFDQGVVFYDDVRSPVTPDLHGRLCVVGLIDGRVLVKIIRSANDGTFHLFSNTVEEPIMNAEVEWAALVKDVRPR